MDEPQVSWVDDRNNTSYHPSTPSKKKSKSKKLEFVGWGSKPLIEFLISIGRDTSELISQHDATAIITRYVNDNGLVHPTRKKRINCDERLQAVFGKKTIARNKVHALLEPHYPDSDDELIFSSDEDENDVTSEHRATTPQRKTPPKKKEVETNRSCFAAVIPHNLKFVYLKRSFVLELLNDPQFEEKVVGCYVRVKADPNDYLQKNSHCLLQIKGIKKVPGVEGTSTEILFHVSNFLKDIPISFLSDENFSEEECDDLCQRIKDGLLNKPTVGELEQKAQILHEGLTKHRIARELALLQKQIDRANEKGWRKELFEYLERRDLLQTPAEQSRLLHEVPIVIAEPIEQEASVHGKGDGVKQGVNNSQQPIAEEASIIPICDNAADDADGSRNSEFAGRQADLPMSEIQDDLPISMQPKEPVEIQSDPTILKQQAGSELQASSLKSKRPIEEEDPLDFPSEKRQRLLTDILKDRSSAAPQPMRNEEIVNVKNNIEPQPTRNEEHKVAELIGSSNVPAQPWKRPEVIDLSDDEDEKVSNINVESYEWYYIDPQGAIQGPFPIGLLRVWKECGYFPPDFKVWRSGQNQNHAVLLSNLLSWAYQS